MNIILTGASSGIGESILKELLLLSDVKILTLSRRKPNINSEKIRWIECDLSNEKEIEIIKTELEEFKCDVLINNAGSGKVQDLIDLNYNDILNFVLCNERRIRNTIAGIKSAEQLIINETKPLYAHDQTFKPYD